MWAQKIDYVDAVEVPRQPVKKQVWDGKNFVPLTLHKISPYSDQIYSWLRPTYGAPGVYVNGRFWDYSVGGNYFLMDEKVYTWYQMKWSKE